MNAYEHPASDYTTEYVADLIEGLVTSSYRPDPTDIVSAPISATPGTRIPVYALNIDERYLGHRIDGVDASGLAFEGQLRAIARHQVDGRILITVGDGEHQLEYRAPATVTVVRSMPTDPQLRTGRRTAAPAAPAVIELAA